MDASIRAVKFLSRVSGVVAALMIAAAVLIICDMVFERYILNLTTIWQIDAVTYLVVSATFVGSAYVLMTKGHVNVEILPLHIGPRARYWLALSTAFFAMGFVAVLWWLCTQFFWQAWAEGWRSNTVWRARLWIPYSAMPIGIGILFLQYVVDFVCLATGRTQPFGIKVNEDAEEFAREQAKGLLGDMP
ncbi:MAG: TRAP transporter small permease [Pseudolabrys sp.]|jgi:TRAP-type C4-dicarboxylate transport system permease small subunit